MVYFIYYSSVNQWTSHPYSDDFMIQVFDLNTQSSEAPYDSDFTKCDYFIKTCFLRSVSCDFSLLLNVILLEIRYE